MCIYKTLHPIISECTISKMSGFVSKATIFRGEYETLSKDQLLNDFNHSPPPAVKIAITSILMTSLDICL